MYEGYATDKCFDILAYWDISDMGYRNGCHCYVPHVHTKQICYRKGFYKIKEYMKNWEEKEIYDALTWRLRRNENLTVWKEDEIMMFKKQYPYKKITKDLIDELKNMISEECLQETISSYKECLKVMSLFNHF